MCRPKCGAELDLEWWQEAMDAAAASGFEKLDIVTPCCGTRATLHDLRYEWPAGVARFVVEAMNPNEDLTDDRLQAIGNALGCKLRKVWRP